MKIPVSLALITLCREFLVTGMRMVAASKGVIVSRRDREDKSKTLSPTLAASDFCSGCPDGRMRDQMARVLPWDVAPVPRRSRLSNRPVLDFMST